jgi:catechol 2,3-dioxygenase-like lactoylglutathione lyase family enzyme
MTDPAEADTGPGTPSPTTILGRMTGGTFDQIGIVVPDLDAAMADFTRKLGLGPWAIWDYVPPFLPRREFHGRPGTFSMRAGFAGTGPQVELIEPLEGPSVWHEFLATRGRGIHHLAFFVPSFEQAAAELRQLGAGLLMSGGGHGLDGDGIFGYFDTEPWFGFVVEAIQHPARRPPPSRMFPAPPGAGLA